MSTQSPITTHILDIHRGHPAADVPVTLERQANEGWDELATSTTDANGRASNLLDPGSQIRSGVYRLTFHVASYFHGQDTRCFYPFVTVAFEIADPNQHYHVPLLLSPYGYSTYRGS